ncbi:MAG: cytochrome c biogenesis protein CcmG/thiol:disulfide interchange protein DsbE [Polyangiales bacterium]|jgi:cytochrome c biogenesis protein CcmG/thiol:disulfide interchange protein DsbE
MKKDVLRLIPAFALIIALATGLSLWTDRAQPAPVFTLDVIAGEGVGDRVSLANLRGEVVVLEFWASWCSACRRSVPALNAFHERLPDVQIYGITSERLTPGELRAAHDRFGFDFPTLRDDQGLADVFGVESLPTVVVIDQEGRVRWHQMGTVSTAELVAQIRPFASESMDSGDDS